MSTNINSLIASIIKLNGSNYYDWKFAMQMILRRAGCWHVVSGKLLRPDDDPKKAAIWDSLSEDGLTAIGLAVEQSETAHIRECNTGPGAWKALAAIYERNGRATRIMLKRQFYMFSHEIENPIIEYVTGITTIVSKLKAIGVTVEDEDVTDVLIYALAPEYTAVATSLMQLTSSPSIADITASLIEAEEQMKKLTPEGALGALNVSTRKPKYSTNNRGSSPKCHRCLKLGHIAHYCRASAPVEDTALEDDVHAKMAFTDPHYPGLQLF
ncbi:unnamed protein product [Somion occarium]|uniref:Uncharacterized protein n=1 Tax=Somion occarium TaxID=3059160 RepID=A0ABP1DJF6_9APHY